jgi:hypothetical protein
MPDVFNIFLAVSRIAFKQREGSVMKLKMKIA